ncbi:MAG: SLATT domain-containing protein [Azoarcus sp.]|jgi:hypothetical protein|nr:SLATT domain-containing protein [Azoarcus sp.]
MAEQYEVHTPSTKRSIAAELQRLEENCIQRGKVQSLAAARWSRYHYYIGIAAIALSILANMTFSGNLPALAAGLSALVAVLTALMTFLKPSVRAAAHRMTGSQYLGLHNEARVFRETHLFHDCNDQTALAGLDGFTRRENELDKASRPVSRRDEATAKALLGNAGQGKVEAAPRIGGKDEPGSA